MGQPAGSFPGGESGGAGRAAARIAVFVSDRMKSDAMKSHAVDQMMDHAAFDTRVMVLGAIEPADYEGPTAGERFNAFDLTRRLKEPSCHGPLPAYLASSSAGDETAARLGGAMTSPNT